MLFLETNKGNCTALTNILRKYEEASGQSINNAKSAITFSRKTPLDLKLMTKGELKIEKEGGTGKYLGLPEHFGRRKRDMFSSIVDRIKMRAHSWTNKLLSSAGKLVMLQSVLSAVPSYSMSYFALPISLCKRIQSAVTRFWWDNNESQRKMAWVSWDSMAKPKAIGGLGVRDFQTFNVALLAKISWRLLHNPDCLLSRVLMGKYSPDANILLATEASAMSQGWRSILMDRDLLVQNLGWLVGNGQSISVWNDPWLNSRCQERPTGPPVESFKDLTVSELMVPESCEWDIRKIQLCAPDFEDKIVCIKPSQTGAPDKLIWLGTKSGDYSTRSGYYFAVDREETRETFPTENTFTWKKSVWGLDCAPKIKMFSWNLLKGAIPVGERLLERHVPIDACCKRCGESKSIAHLFFQCQFARDVWSLPPFATELEISGTIDLAAVWPSLCSKTCLPLSGITSKALAPWILWSIWKNRNKFFFEGHSVSPRDALSQALSLARE